MFSVITFSVNGTLNFKRIYSSRLKTKEEHNKKTEIIM